MADYGLTKDGFLKKSRQEIIDDMILRAKNEFGVDINTSDKNPLIKIIKNAAYELEKNWNANESVYNASYVDFASGQSLDFLCKLIGITRRGAVSANGIQTFTGDNGTEIPEGFLVQTESDIQFFTTESGIIESGSIDLEIEALEEGEEGNVDAGTITEVVNPISGLDSTTNSSETVNGRDRENDYELRERFKQSVSIGGASTVESIRASVLQIDSVIDAIIFENVSMVEEGGIPPKAIECLVYGGQEENIVDTIFETKAAGIEAFGEVIVQKTDSMGRVHDIGYTRPTEIEIDVSADISTTDEFPLDGVEQVTENIVMYIGGSYNGEEYNGLGLGDDVIYTKVIAAIHEIDGITDVVLELNTTSGNITIDEYEVSTTNETLVDVI